MVDLGESLLPRDLELILRKSWVLQHLGNQLDHIRKMFAVGLTGDRNGFGHSIRDQLGFELVQQIRNLDSRVFRRSAQ